MREGNGIARLVIVAAALLAAGCARAPRWRALPEVTPSGTKQSTGSFTVDDRSAASFERPPVVYDERVCTGRKRSNVVVLIYDPILESEGGVRLTEHVSANDPVEYSHILVNVIREASWGYVNYEIVDVITVDGFPIKQDGFRYDDASFLEVRATQEWQPSTSSYRAMLEENGLLERVQRGEVHEVWVWGASGMHFDEFAMYIPNRYARFGPTDNPWLYRPYDIPAECGRTLWMMGFNYEVGADNMVHSYTHRVESMGALQYGDGIWDTKKRRDAWNVFTILEMDFAPKGEEVEGATDGSARGVADGASAGASGAAGAAGPARAAGVSMVGNCHVPPNGESGYDYDNSRRVLSFADHWRNYPDLRGSPRLVSSDEWGNNHFGYQKWILEHLPKGPGSTPEGYNNWWVYVANTDEDLPEWTPPAASTLLLPDGLPPLH